MGGQGETVDAPLWVGQDKGFYDEQGIDLDMQTFPSAAQMFPALASKQLDAGHGSINPGFYNAIQNRLPLRIIVAASVMHPLDASYTKNANAIIVRKAIADQVNSVSDLKGKTIALIAEGTGQEANLSDLLESGGLSLADVTIQGLAFPDMLAALASGAIDAANQIEPFVTIGEAQGISVRKFDFGSVDPWYPIQVLFFGPSLTQDHPDVGVRFTTAYVKSMRYIDDGFFKAINRDDVIRLYNAHTSLKDPALFDRMGLFYWEPNGRIETRYLDSDQDFFVQGGWETAKVDPAQLVDPRFSTAAIQALGVYS